jgi:hypothetical protein
VAEFGEKVWYRPLHGKQRTSLDPVMNEGIFASVVDKKGADDRDFRRVDTDHDNLGYK